MKLSTRNQLPGTLTWIARHAVEDLELAEGSQVIALITATEGLARRGVTPPGRSSADAM